MFQCSCFFWRRNLISFVNPERSLTGINSLNIKTNKSLRLSKFYLNDVSREEILNTSIFINLSEIGVKLVWSKIQIFMLHDWLSTVPSMINIGNIIILNLKSLWYRGRMSMWDECRCGRSNVTLGRSLQGIGHMNSVFYPIVWIKKALARFAWFIKHLNHKKKLVFSGASALFTCSGSLRSSFFQTKTMFRLLIKVPEQNRPISS